MKPWPRDQLKKGEEELRRRLDEEFRRPENFEIIPTNCCLSRILYKGDKRQPDLVCTDKGYDEHLHFPEAPIRSLSLGINGSQGDPHLSFNPVAPSGAPAMPISWSKPTDRVFAGVPAMPFNHFEAMEITSPPVSSMFGATPSLNAFRNASSTLVGAPLNGQSSYQFGQTTEVS